MNVGEKIFSNNTKQTFTVLQILKAGGQSEVCYAKSDKSEEVFFLKRFLNIKYSDRPYLKERCEIFETDRKRLYTSINKRTLPGATCTFIIDFFRENTFYYVVTSKINGFGLSPSKLASAMSIEDRLFFFRILAYSLMPFEDYNIIHGDIKPDNVIVEINENCLVPRIIDFESAFFADNPPQRGYIVGTEPYYSPELADYNSEREDSSETKLSCKSDIFSLGLILYEILTGSYPYTEGNQYWYEATKNGKVLEMPPNWSDSLKCLVLSMLDRAPSKRPSIKEIVTSLKNIKDVTNTVIPLAKPIIKIEYESKGKAYVKLLNVCKNTQMSYCIGNENYHNYEHGFYIYDDDILLKTKLTRINGDSQSFCENISVSENRNMKCKRPHIKITDGTIHIYHEWDDVKIFYTTDGTTPTVDSCIYTEPFKVKENTIIKAIAKRIGYLLSDTSTINSSSKIKMS